MNDYKILLYNRPMEMPEEINDEPIVDNFLLTTDHKYLTDAVAVIFHMPTMLEGDKILNRSRKMDGQVWVFWSMECEAHYVWQSEPRIMDLFDLTATYKMDSDIPVPYLYSHYPEILRRAPAPKNEFVNAFISSTIDKSNRIKYLKELMGYIDVHSYGKVLNNKELSGDEGFITKSNIISGYKFTLAFENAIQTDYVTEKFFDPLIAGSVPVYLGAPNIEDFVPAEKCYINVDSFSSVKSLADYLLELNDSDQKYREYLQWKKIPLRDSFTKKAEFIGHGSPLLRLCYVLKMRMGS